MRPPPLRRAPIAPTVTRQISEKQGQLTEEEEAARKGLNLRIKVIKIAYAAMSLVVLSYLTKELQGW